MIEKISSNIFSDRKIAYFSMEIGIRQEFSTYSGGLGILAGDTVYSAADLKVPLIAFTLASRKGHFHQEISPLGRQIEHPDEWHPERYCTPLPEVVEVNIQKRPVKVQGWLYVVESTTGGLVPIIFLDTNHNDNAPEDRSITDSLYGDGDNYRIRQEIILGVGAYKFIKVLGLDIMKYHLNEGHASFLLLELLKEHKMDIDKVRKKCVFTTHTPVEAAFDKYTYDVVADLLGDLVPIESIKKYAGENRMNMTLLALNLSGFVNGVAKKHQETTQQLFPSYAIRAITNGVHSYRWTHPAFRKLYDRYIPGWAKQPQLLVRVKIIPDDEIWDARHEAKHDLLRYVNTKTGKDFTCDKFTIGFARRATTYKRHTLLFSDIERLKKINRKYPFQLIFAGKAHPADGYGKHMIEEIFSYIEYLRNEIKIVYLPNYDIEMASRLISGVDLWLNTPQRPMEASGTSGMKAAHNGVINFSVPDGWWAEGCIEGVSGWRIGPTEVGNTSPEDLKEQEISDLYNKLEYVILPMYYDQRDRWLEMMDDSIATIAYYFNSHRMMQSYIIDAYFL